MANTIREKIDAILSELDDKLSDLACEVESGALSNDEIVGMIEKLRGEIW